MHRGLDSRLGILERQCKSVEHQGSKPIEPLTLGGRLLYPQIVSAGVAHVLRLRTAPCMRTFISTLDVDEDGSLRLAIGAYYGAVYGCFFIIIAWIYLALLLYKKVNSHDVINC